MIPSPEIVIVAGDILSFELYCATIGTTQDELIEGNHGFNIDISLTNETSDITLGSQDSVIITIIDDDGMLFYLLYCC